MTNRTNNKSKMTTVRVPHEVMEAMEAVKMDGESTAGFLVTAARGEITRRQLSGTAEDTAAAALEALAHIRDGADNARKELVRVIKLADKAIG